MSRQTISPPIALVPPPPSKAKRNRTWESQNPTVSYRLPLQLRDAITSLAKAELITTSELVRYLLEHAIEQHAAGKLPIQPELTTGKYSLYPEK